MNRKLTSRKEHWKIKTPFRISNYEWTGFDIAAVEIAQGDKVARGEAEGIYYENETPDSLLVQIANVKPAIESGATREQLQSLLPRGGARCALDCALWDLEAQITGKSVWTLAGLEPKPLKTVFTIGLEETPEAMAAKALEVAREFPLKIKLNADRPVERVAAIRKARPDVTINVVDCNGGWTFDQLKAWAPELAKLGVKLIEQPLPRGKDEALEGYRAPLPLFGDEACLDRSELEQASRRYQGIVIKMDKTGGLTEALALARAAKGKGMKLLAGCMAGTSVLMAPTHVVGQLCDFVDIDAPLLLAEDRPNGLRYDGPMVSPRKGGSWGA